MQLQLHRWNVLTRVFGFGAGKSQAHLPLDRRFSVSASGSVRRDVMSEVEVKVSASSAKRKRLSLHVLGSDVRPKVLPRIVIVKPSAESIAHSTCI